MHSCAFSSMRLNDSAVTSPTFPPRSSLRSESRSFPIPSALPSLDTPTLTGAGAVAASVAGLVIARTTAYSQTQVIRAGMLGNVVPRAAPRVLLVGGDPKDLYYLPQGLGSVLVRGPDVDVKLWKQASTQAGVPVDPMRTGSWVDVDLDVEAGTCDAALMLIPFSSLGGANPKELCQTVLACVRGGGRMIIVQRVLGSSALQGLVGGWAGATTDDLDSLSGLTGMADIKWEVGSGLDPHAAGVIMRAGVLKKGLEEPELDAERLRGVGKKMGKTEGKRSRT